MNRLLLNLSAEDWLKKFFQEKSFQFLSIERRKKLPRNLTFLDWSIGVGAEVDHYFDVEYLDKEKSQEKCFVKLVRYGIFSW